MLNDKTGVEFGERAILEKHRDSSGGKVVWVLRSVSEN